MKILKRAALVIVGLIAIFLIYAYSFILALGWLRNQSFQKEEYDRNVAIFKQVYAPVVWCMENDPTGKLRRFISDSTQPGVTIIEDPQN